MMPLLDSHRVLLRALASFPGTEGDAFQAALHAELLTPFLDESQALLTLRETSGQQLEAAVRSLNEIVDQHVYWINE